MSKALLALLAAGVTAPIVATNGEILTRLEFPRVLQYGGDSVGIRQGMLHDEMFRFLENPEMMMVFLQSKLQLAAESIESAAMDWGDDAHESFYSDPVFFGNYSSGELSSLYAQAYPGYEKTMGSYAQPQSSPSFSMGQFGNTGTQGLGGSSFGGMGGLSDIMGSYPGRTTQAEFNDIVFD